ncbi:hypothetical protein PUNSTDRAFT_144000 [Punctularia strigosozonata HHB-11173 SS5]|uniref:uncharacterized protein n=1 Tax=Punctularia strigosozonata (strain HHB-11173) TaxID=741275 RepID=UPI0004417D8A|nr:uncharacterized protein PUNSTDRAFT_144000 [Punctularia strigosozonata HHB-11173 SS5]EIN08388.1 hypothetical protein PUNSTDRAFT_144000 [Punctularia strigosozonata HHB-11173 SS5]
MTSESTSQGGEVDFDASISEEDLKEELPDAKLGPVPSSSRKSPQAFKRAPREHLAHHIAMKEAFPDGWAPTRKLSRAAMDGIRTLHKHDPDTFSTPVLAEKFRISPEAVRRILKSSWQPSSAEQARLAQREARLKQARIEASKEREREERLKWRRRERLTMV